MYTHDLFHFVRCGYRFIDDVFMIWDGSEDQLKAVFNTLNLSDDDIWFTMVHSSQEIQFLDMLVYKSGNRLETDLFVKETDRNNLLRYDSNHPRLMVDSLPWSQLLRVRCIVSDESKVDERLEVMCNKFLHRGYPGRLVDEYRTQTRVVQRSSLLSPKSSTNKGTRISFVSTFGPNRKQIANIIRKHWPMLC